MSFRERLRFDAQSGEYRDGDIRYMMIRPDALMGIVRELPQAMRGDMLAAFARSITRAGGGSARAYQAAGAASPRSLIATIAATAPELGWGIWDLRIDGDRLALDVRNSPFVEGHGLGATPVCHAIVGMMGAIGPMILGRPVEVSETQCACMGHTLCRFEAVPLAD